MPFATDTAAALLRLLPPETAHRATIALLRGAARFLPEAPKDDPKLRIDVLGLEFSNPIGLAAGFDKDGVASDALGRLGFGFVECGTVTPEAQDGNPRPRLFRLTEDQAIINRMGFNNQGMAAMAGRLARQRHGQAILGINLGANKTSIDRSADYVRGFRALAQFAAYVTINVSSPNTPGLRGLQDKAELQRLLGSLTEARSGLALRVPLLLKIAPDIDAHAADDIAAVALESGIEGLIVSNTTLARPTSLRSPFAGQTGGLSGVPLFAPSTALLRAMHARVGSRLVLVGVGGIASGADAYAKIRAGASLVQLYTALVFKGPGLLESLKQELLACLARDGFGSIAAAVGTSINSPA